MGTPGRPRSARVGTERVGGIFFVMTQDTNRRWSGSPRGADRELMQARWARLAEDFARLPFVEGSHADRTDRAARADRTALRDVGALLISGQHDVALADAEHYVVEGHTIRTGHVVEFDDIDDETALVRWAGELDRASAEGYAPPVPDGFWASFLWWRTPLGMARLTERPSSRPRVPTPRPPIVD